ncbi:uncharacterized protein LOC108713881 isoform X1 [Xenopus laevis]|uniref:Uncharacterized protein LOC108713881 isoform X1 n=1 Tax=Xenopus laevis TaxID=8355 RepID=A0A8J0UZM1_XENLA|nr:uncharacterized protein LOC108713881 isoform X1 [Xenopus laevis]
MQRKTRKIGLPEARASWEEQGVCEVAAGKLEVMEKFFTPLPRPDLRRSVKDQGNVRSGWNEVQEPYYAESLSSSSSPSSSSAWSSECNFRGREGFSRYHSHDPHSRSCNDLTVGKGRRNDDDDRRVFTGKCSGNLVPRRSERDSTERLSTGAHSAGSNNLKVPSGHGLDGGLLDAKGTYTGNMKNGGRRARSMEVLSEKETQKEQKMYKRNIKEEKQKFSKFLDEITVQVLSPSNLNSLGVKGQKAGAHTLLKNSSTDSSGSRGNKGHHAPAVQQQDIKRKGKEKEVASVRSIPVADRPGLRRSRDLSTSPDSASSVVWNKEMAESRSGVTTVRHALKNTEIHRQHDGVRAKQKPKGGSLFEPTGRDKKEGHKKGKAVFDDKTPSSSEFTPDHSTPVPLIPPPDWWRDSVTSQASEKNTDNFRDTSKRMVDELSNTLMNDHQEKSNSIKLETEKDSLNHKITELLDHLVRAQSTICALEKLNVSSLLANLPPNMLEKVTASQQSPDGSSQVQTSQNVISTRIFSEASPQDISGKGLQSKVEKEIVKVPAEPRLTAFAPWSPADKSFPILQSLYSSTESECSLEDTLPSYKLLSPRFPNLGESFSEDRKDEANSYDGETRVKQRMANLSLSNLLPTHHLHSHCTRISSSESSGDDATLGWGQMLSQGPSFDYQSAQKILDTFLGFTSPFDKHSTAQNMAGLPITDATQTVAKAVKADKNNTELVPRSNPKNVSSTCQSKDALKLSTRTSHNKSPSSSPSPLHHSRDDPYHRSHMVDPRMPQLPAKRSSLPRSGRNSYPSPKTVEETRFSPVGVQEGSNQSKSEFLHPLVSVSTPGNISEYHNNNAMTAYALRSPTGSEPIIKAWDYQGSHQSSWSEEGTEKKPRKEKTVHFYTLNSDEHNGKGQLTIKSKCMATRLEDQGLGDSTSLDSTLL